MECSLCAGRVPHPPGSRRRERPPYGAGETRRPPGKMQFPRPLQTNVGDDARTAPAGAFRRPTGPQVRLLGRRSSRGVRGGVGFGRGMPLPYMASGHDRPNGLAAAARANVGRDALIPPHPAAGQGSAGGINPAPTGKFCVSGKPGGHNVCPGLQGRATALPQRSAARQAGPIWNRPLHGVFAAARGSRDDASIVPYIPLQLCKVRVFPPDSDIVDGRRGGFHIRPVYGGAGFRGRDKSRPYE